MVGLFRRRKLSVNNATVFNVFFLKFRKMHEKLEHFCHDMHSSHEFSMH